MKENCICFNCLITNHRAHYKKKNDNTSEATMNHAAVNLTSSAKPQGCLRIIHVPVSAGSSTVETYALLDGGVTTTFCSDKLVHNLCIQGTPITYNVSTMHDT